MKYMSIYGSRPQSIKLIDNLPNHILVNTGQHYDFEMNDIFEKQLKIRPKYNLGKTELGDIYEKSCQIIAKENPDLVLCYGDTRSTLGGALAAKFSRKTLAHVESGMRSGDITQPEELNRIIVDRISDFKFCANDYARQNLVNEGLGGEVYVVGDPMWDNLKKVLPIPKSKDFEKYNLITIHREQTVESPEALKNIIEALTESGERFVFPIHPRTKRNLTKFKIKIPKNVEVIKPQGYKEMIRLETNAKKILTDSGGVTREAYWFLKPLIIFRTETEWGEIVQDGWGVLVGNRKDLILQALKNHNPNVKTNKPNYWPSYGAKDRIKSILCGS